MQVKFLKETLVAVGLMAALSGCATWSEQPAKNEVVIPRMADIPKKETFQVVPTVEQIDMSSDQVKIGLSELPVVGKKPDVFIGQIVYGDEKKTSGATSSSIKSKKSSGTNKKRKALKVTSKPPCENPD